MGYCPYHCAYCGKCGVDNGWHVYIDDNMTWSHATHELMRLSMRSSCGHGCTQSICHKCFWEHHGQYTKEKLTFICNKCEDPECFCVDCKRAA